MRIFAKRSARHEHRQVGLGENIARRAAKDHLAQAALRVGALHQEIGAQRGRAAVLRSEYVVEHALFDRRLAVIRADAHQSGRK